MKSPFYLYALLALVYGSPFIFAIALALPPTLRDRSWKTFGQAVCKAFFGIVLPLLVFVLSSLYQTSSKAECRHVWWACFMWMGKVPLFPFFIWAVAALFVYDINKSPNRDQKWVTTGIFIGTLTTVLMVAYLLFMGIGKALTHNPRLIIVLATTPFYMSIWGTIRTYQFWRQGILKLRACIVAALSSIPFWLLGMLLSKRIYASLPENSGCFVVTAAMQGHEAWVGPFTPCPDRGAPAKANRQLLIFWQFEALWESRQPWSHRLFRRVYNRLGPPLARLVISPWIADAFYLALKPAEWAARILLILTPWFSARVCTSSTLKLFSFHDGGGQGTDRPTQANWAGGRARSPLRAGIMPESRHWITGVFLALTIMIVAGAITSSVSVRRTAFCTPAAHVAGLLSGAPCVKDGDDYRLIGSDLDLTVAPACAAVDYFCLMAGFLSLLVTRRHLRLYTQLLVLPVAWGLTILINALRLTACWQTDRLVQPLLPESIWQAPHMAVGIVTFLAGLTFIFWLMTARGGSGFRIQEINRTDNRGDIQ